MEYYVYLNGTRRGPFSNTQIQEDLARGVLHPQDLAAPGPEAELRPLSHFPLDPSATTEPESPKAVEPVVRNPSPDSPALAANSLGPYARATLAPNETPFFKTSLHWIIFVRFAFLALLVFLFIAIPFAIGVQVLTGSERAWFALPLPTFIMIPPTLAYLSSELVITDMRVLIKTGIVRRRTLEMFISKVESIAVDQGLLGRMLNYGSVSIRGTGGMQEPFETIAKPVEFRNCVQRLQGEATRITGRG